MRAARLPPPPPPPPPLLAAAVLLTIFPPRAVSLTFFTRLAGDFDYADKWARAAIGGAKTAFTNGLYDGDFDTYNSGGALARVSFAASH